MSLASIVRSYDQAFRLPGYGEGLSVGGVHIGTDVAARHLLHSTAFRRWVRLPAGGVGYVILLVTAFLAALVKEPDLARLHAVLGADSADV